MEALWLHVMLLGSSFAVSDCLPAQEESVKSRKERMASNRNAGTSGAHSPFSSLDTNGDKLHRTSLLHTFISVLMLLMACTVTLKNAAETQERA